MISAQRIIRLQLTLQADTGDIGLPIRHRIWAVYYAVEDLFNQSVPQLRNHLWAIFF